jgi:putative membrane protein
MIPGTLGAVPEMPGMPGMHGTDRLPFNVHNAMTQWDLSAFPLLVLVVVIAAAVWYLRAESALSARGRRWSGKRTVSFMAGLVAVDLALQSPVATFSMGYFQAHVIQHLLLMVAAPPLLALGAPMTLALQTSSRSGKVRLLRVLNARPFQLLTHPIPVWFLYYFSMFAFFLTFALGFAMNHMWLMDLINLAFLFASTLFWWPMVGLDPIPHWQMGHGLRMANLMIGIPIESFLGLALLSSTHAAASMYTVAGTHAGGAILWIGAEFFTFLALIPVFVQWVRFEERKGLRYDAQLDAELAAGEASSGTEPRPAPVVEPLEPR